MAPISSRSRTASISSRSTVTRTSTRATKTRCWARRSTAKSLACSRAASRKLQAAPSNARLGDPFMEFVLKGGSLEKQRTGCIVVGVYEGGQLSPSAMELDTASGHAVNEALSRGDLDGELGTTLLLTSIPKMASERVLLVGLGPEREFVESSYHTALCA